jgi:hypothetical protein
MNGRDALWVVATTSGERPDTESKLSAQRPILGRKRSQPHFDTQRQNPLAICAGHKNIDQQ